MTSWLKRLIAQLVDEDFIDESGDAYYADGDAGEYNHDMRAIENILAQSDIDPEQIGNWDPEKFDQTLLEQVEQHFPGFTQMVASGNYLPKEFAVMKMGWIRVHDDNFELWKLNEPSLNRIMDYVWDRLHAGDNEEITIEERSTGRLYSAMTLELGEAISEGNGLVYLQRRNNRPQSTNPALYIWD